MFPPKLVDKTVKNFLDKNLNKDETEIKPEVCNSYFKLPYIGEHSDFVSKT